MVIHMYFNFSISRLWLRDNEIYWISVITSKAKLMYSFAISTYFHLRISLERLPFRLPPHPDVVQIYQFSYCSLVITSRLTFWMFTFLGHHFVYMTRWDLEIWGKPDGRLTRRADGCVLRATEQITQIRTEWNSLPDTFKESLAPAGNRMKPAETDNAWGSSSSQKIWPGVSFSFSGQIQSGQKFSWNSEEGGIILPHDSSFPCILRSLNPNKTF